jgi:hypothetical protein
MTTLDDSRLLEIEKELEDIDETDGMKTDIRHKQTLYQEKKNALLKAKLDAINKEEHQLRLRLVLTY